MWKKQRPKCSQTNMQAQAQKSCLAAKQSNRMRMVVSGRTSIRPKALQLPALSFLTSAADKREEKKSKVGKVAIVEMYH